VDLRQKNRIVVGQYDEIVRYKAYQFPDNMEFEAGMEWLR